MKKTTTKKGLKSSSASGKMGRAPVVVILGHIDHGKTTLLSKIKEIDLVRKEHGGITQHIAAYQVKVEVEKGKPAREITFVDTPGHAAFNEMRSRGAKIADLAILVVAANDGVKPQTKESLKYINEVGLNYLVALNKIDLPEVKIEQAKKDLAENGVSIEEYGGKIVLVPVSAKTGQGIKDLLEMILLLGEMMELKGKASNLLEAVVLESKLDAHRGPLATVLIRDGSLKIGDEIRVGRVYGKIKAIFDDRGQSVKEALVSQPVEILGFKGVPLVGEKVERISRENFEKKKLEKKETSLKKPDSKEAKELINISGSGTVNSSRKTKTLTAIIKRVKKGNLLDRL